MATGPPHGVVGDLDDVDVFGEVFEPERAAKTGGAIRGQNVRGSSDVVAE